jgi:hypothetical protein
MLFDEKQFAIVENELRQKGIIDTFEKENGKITGHMMITLVDIPPELGIEADGKKGSYAFGCSFDFSDCSLGVIFNVRTCRPESGLWTTMQAEDGKELPREWSEFFIETLVQNIVGDGSFGYPLYTFLNDTSDFTVVPTSL